MATNSTIYRFQIELSDIDRGLYETLELRVARHPSESVPFLLTRVIAYALNVQEGLEFTQGIAATDEPALQVKDLTGRLLTWIEIGNPTPRRLHKATKTAKSVRVYTYRDPAILIKEVQGNEVHRVASIELFSLPPEFLNRLGETLGRNNVWVCLHSDGELSITVHDVTVHGQMGRHSLGAVFTCEGSP